MNSMSVEPGKSLEPPPLPGALLEPWPVIAVGALAWLVAAVAAFVVPALATWRPTTLAGLVAAVAAFVVPCLETWRPLTLAGLGVGVLGTSIFLWQRDAARRGARGAQVGLDYQQDPNRE